jgi:hypothetical protein
MNPNPVDPILRALFDDEAWQASCRETRARAGARLRRRRGWRQWRVGLAAVVMAAGACWLANHEREFRDSRPDVAGEAPAPEEVRLHLALNLPMAADGPLTVRAYEPLPDWTLHCEPLADTSPANPATAPAN